MSAEILISILVENGENMVLLELVNTGISKTLGKALQIKNITGVKYKEMKKPTKWETKAGTFTTKETTCIKDACLLQFTTKRSFNINKCTYSMIQMKNMSLSSKEICTKILD